MKITQGTKKNHPATHKNARPVQRFNIIFDSWC